MIFPVSDPVPNSRVGLLPTRRSPILVHDFSFPSCLVMFRRRNSSCFDGNFSIRSSRLIHALQFRALAALRPLSARKVEMKMTGRRTFLRCTFIVVAVIVVVTEAGKDATLFRLRLGLIVEADVLETLLGRNLVMALAAALLERGARWGARATDIKRASGI